MAGLTNILEDLDYYSIAHQTYLRFATKYGPIGNWSEESFSEEVVGRLSASVSSKGPLRILGIGSGAGDVDCKMMENLLPFFPKIHNTIVEPSEAQLSHFKDRVNENKKELQNVSFTWRQDTLDSYVQQLESDIGGRSGITDIGGRSGIREEFHLIHLVHSLYYTDDLTKTLRVLHAALAEGGVLFICILPKDSLFNKLANIQIKHGAARPSLLMDRDVTMTLDALDLPYTLNRGTWYIPSSVCYDENSSEGQHLLDFLTHTKNFRGTTSAALLDEVLTCFKSHENSNALDHEELVVRREWVHVMIAKE